MLPPHKTLKPMPKKIAIVPRSTPSVKAALIEQTSEELKVHALKQGARVNPPALRVLGE